MTASPPACPRLRFERFRESDAAGLAAVLADPEVSRNITTNTSSPERCLHSARYRIEWHNGSWNKRGFGVWALRPRDAQAGNSNRILGWCGFAPPDIEAEEPEILYGLARDYWGQGLATEAARGAITWLFAKTNHPGVAAMVFGRLNPASVKVAQKLGMTRRGTLPYADFLPNKALAQEVLDFEVWRLAEGSCADPEALLFQAPYKAGQVVATGAGDPAAVEAALCAAAQAREDYRSLEPAQVQQRVSQYFQEGLAEAHVDWYALARHDWQAP